ncbi:Glutathione S-transferase S1 [Mortierella sp. GBA30]|nr:Glutathione S-transferase S1 [Mortierella sp. GBA30]
MVHKLFSDASVAAFNDASSRRDSTFRVHYFPFQGFAYTARLILATTGAKFESTSPANWPAEKGSTPFGVLPILYETVSIPGTEEQVLEIPESGAIEQYLARKFDLLGSSSIEETRIHAFASSANSIGTFVFLRIFFTKDVTHKQELLEQFVTKTAPAWVQMHEDYLTSIKTNGHVVGGRLSLADIKAVITIELIRSLASDDDLISAKKTPGLWRVWETINAIPSYVAWKQTESYKKLDAGHQVFLQGFLTKKE